ncbi:MAG: hypothetical protein IT173_08300 [Acidobacteria bacterium]|nr:hypothetical protein [Acidobacteriota bacterium]
MNKRFAVPILAILALLPLFGLGQDKLPDSSIKTIYITPTSHYDFGFVEPPDAVRERAARHIDEVIRVAELDPNFRWTIESVWQVNEWLRRAVKPTSVLPNDRKKIAHLMNLIRSGRVALSMSWGSMHTDFMGDEELNRLFLDYAKLRLTYGISSEFALMDDVPGHPSTIPSVLAGSGGRYLVVGANTFINNATSLAPGNVPFYWQSPDGSKVLTWITQSPRGGYTEALTDYFLDPYSLDPYTDRTPFEMFEPNLAEKQNPLQRMEFGVKALLDRYNKAGYKYDAVMTIYAHDFIEPDYVKNLERAVNLWNSKHKGVRLKIATPPEFLDHIESKYGPQIPTFRGEWSGLWSEAKTQSPRISAIARYDHDHVPVAETLWSAVAMTRRIPFPAGNLTELYDLMFTYDEHSGAGNTGWPQLNKAEALSEQNRQYVNMATTGKASVDRLLNTGIKTLVQPSRYDDPQTVPADRWFSIVYNGLSWTRDDVVRLRPPRKDTKIVRVRDVVSQADIAFDIDEKGNAVFIAKQIPAFGYKTFAIEIEPGTATSTLQTVSSNEIKNDRFSVRVNKNGSIESIFDKLAGRDLVNSNGEMPFNELLRVEGSDASTVVYPEEPNVLMRAGDVMSEIVIRRPRSVFPITRLTIYKGIGEVQIRNELDPTEMPFVGGNGNWSDSYYFAFPMNVAKDGLKVIRGGQKWLDTLPDDYLPGARRDSVTTQHIIGLTNSSTTAYIAHRQAFHWVFAGYVSTKVRPMNAPKEFPALYTGKWPLPEATLYSRAIRHGSQADTNDLGVVNMPAVEPGMSGRYVYEYAVAGGSTRDDIVAKRLGQAFNLPLIAEYVQVPPSSSKEGYFAIDQPNVEIVTVKPAANNSARGDVSASPLDPPINKTFVIRVQEFAGKKTSATITLPAKIRSATMVDLTESKVLGDIAQISPLTITLQPYQTATIRVVMQ